MIRARSHRRAAAGHGTIPAPAQVTSGRHDQGTPARFAGPVPGAIREPD
jgi:hypothetical protein